MSFFSNFTFLLLGFAVLHVVLSNEVLESEPDQFRLLPQRLRGSYGVRSLEPGACSVECTTSARTTLDRFTQNLYYQYYERIYRDYGLTGQYNIYERAGIRFCYDVRKVLECYEECNSQQEALGLPRDEPLEFRGVSQLEERYCEEQYTPGHASCRLADTRPCDVKYRKAACGYTLNKWLECQEEVLRNSTQDCSGFCTPARRYYQSQKFLWQMECQLQRAWDFRCSTLVSSQCFSDVKDTDVSLGVYNNMHKETNHTEDLDTLCEVLNSPLACMEPLLTEYVDFYGYNVSAPCSSIESGMAEIASNWTTLIATFCERTPDQVAYWDVCPEPAPLPLVTPPLYNPVYSTTPKPTAPWHSPSTTLESSAEPVVENTTPTQAPTTTTSATPTTAAADATPTTNIATTTAAATTTTTSTTTPTTTTTATTTVSTLDGVAGEKSGRCPDRNDFCPFRSPPPTCATDSECMGDKKCCKLFCAMRCSTPNTDSVLTNLLDYQNN